jgi:hypothetical protein
MTPAETRTTTKVICTECRRENEPQRIYCHNCGERLDRSGVVMQKKVDNAAETHKRLQKMMKGPSRTRLNFFYSCKLMLAAAVTASVVQMALSPEFPAPIKVSAPVQMDLELENAVLKSTVLNYSQQDVNAYLAYRLAGKKKVLNKPLLDFGRAAVVFKEGTCVIGWERLCFGYPLYSLSSYRVDMNSGKISSVNNGGWIGRMPIHPALMKYADIIFADVWSALDRERKLLTKMGSVVVHDGSVTITPATISSAAIPPTTAHPPTP